MQVDREQAQGGVIVPEPDRLYRIESLWGAERHAVELSFTAAFVETLQRAGARVDLENGDLVYERGLRRDVFGVRGDFERRTGSKAPAWLFRWPTERLAFVLPRGRTVVDVEPESGTVIIVPPKACVPIFACLTAPYLGRPVRYDARSFVPLGSRRWRPVTRQIHPDLDLVGADERVLDRAQAAFDAVCGHAAWSWAARKPLACARRDDALRLASELLSVMSSRDSNREHAIAAARAFLGPPPPASSRPADLIEALTAVRRALEAEIMPVRIVVVPSRKHFSALPEMAALRPQVARAPVATDEHGVTVSSNAPLQSATVVHDGCRHVFLPGEDLEDLQISSRHELYHLLEAQMATPAERRRIEGFYAETVANAGPFARPYGFLRQEFLPTMGEVYEGAYGDEGLLWLHRHHGDLADFFDALTGRQSSLSLGSGRRTARR